MKTFLISVCSLIFSLSAFAGQWESREFKGVKYQIFLPQKLATVAKTNLMLTLHGCAQHSEDLATYGNWEKAADQYNTVVVAPDVPNGGVIFGCWDYYGSNHTEQNRNNGPMLELVADLLKDATLKINPRHVYVSGLSSGAAQALLLGCLRPDVFAGVGVNSSPAIPTGSGDIHNPPIDAPTMQKYCEDISSTHDNAFRTQLTSVLVGDADTLVNPQHSKIIVDAFQMIYKTTATRKLDLTTLDGANKNGDGTLYLNQAGKPQLSFILNKGVGHAWAAGAGARASSAYITQNSINYPMYLLQFFETNNRR